MDIENAEPPVMDIQQPTAWQVGRNFIPLPSDPALLTMEHVRTAFAGDWSALKEVVRVAQETDRERRLNISA